MNSSAVNVAPPVSMVPTGPVIVNAFTSAGPSVAPLVNGVRKSTVAVMLPAPALVMVNGLPVYCNEPPFCGTQVDAFLAGSRVHRSHRPNQTDSRLDGQWLGRDPNSTRMPADRLGQVGPGLDDDHEADVDLGFARNAVLGSNFGVQSPRCGECAVSYAARLGIGGFSRESATPVRLPVGY